MHIAIYDINHKNTPEPTWFIQVFNGPRTTDVRFGCATIEEALSTIQIVMHEHVLRNYENNKEGKTIL